MKDEFGDLKEKTFGQNICVKPEVGDAFESFVGQLNDQASRKFVELYRESILYIFKQSEEESLRILRYLIEDLTRLYRTLSDPHLANKDAMLHLVALFSAFDIETRAGNLSKDDLRDRCKAQGMHLKGLVSAGLKKNVNADEEKDPPPPLIVSDKKYPAINLADSLLSGDLLVAVFIDGRYDKSEIHQWLDNSINFAKPGEVPPWKVVISFDTLEDDVVDKACGRMEQQFMGRDVTEPGEMLHIFALRLMIAENDSRSLDEEMTACKAYIDDLLRNGRLPPSETDRHRRDQFDSVHDEHVYWTTDSTKPSFQEIRDHLIAAREQALQNTLPEVAAGLLELMKSDAEAFSKKISPTNSGENSYAGFRLLHKIEPDNFVLAWLSAPRDQWWIITEALQNRYENSSLDGDLSEERDWALKVHQALLDRAQAEEGLSALRIRRIIPDVLQELGGI